MLGVASTKNGLKILLNMCCSTPHSVLIFYSICIVFVDGSPWHPAFCGLDKQSRLKPACSSGKRMCWSAVHCFSFSLTIFLLSDVFSVDQCSVCHTVKMNLHSLHQNATAGHWQDHGAHWGGGNLVGCKHEIETCCMAQQSTWGLRLDQLPQRACHSMWK